MNERIERPELPYIWDDVPPGPVLVVSPHPDDEVCGPGGALIRHREKKDSIYIEVLTSGVTGDPEKRFGDIRALREAEAGKAARALEAREINFWGLPDNFDVTRSDVAMVSGKLRKRIEELNINILYSPWDGEVHSDHHAAALAVKEAAKGLDIVVMGYEVWSPLPADVILDITAHMEEKNALLSIYSSQLYYTDYHHHMAGLNAYRGLFLKRRAGYGEAFRIIRGRRRLRSLGFLERKA